MELCISVALYAGHIVCTTACVLLLSFHSHYLCMRKERNNTRIWLARLAIRSAKKIQVNTETCVLFYSAEHEFDIN